MTNLPCSQKFLSSQLLSHLFHILLIARLLIWQTLSLLFFTCVAMADHLNRFLVLTVLLGLFLRFCHGGVTSTFVRKVEKTIDMPLDADVFKVPSGYNAPQQVMSFCLFFSLNSFGKISFLPSVIFIFYFFLVLYFS